MIIAVDIGSTKLLVGSLDESGRIIDYIKLVTPESPQEALEVVAATIASQFANIKFSEIIVGVPGPVENNHLAWGSNLSPEWKKFNFVEPLEKQFDASVFLENDANLAGLAEVNRLTPIPKSAIYLTIGAGIGSSFVISGKLVPGLLHSEAGMTMLEYDGVVREWEKFASGKAIFEAYEKLAEDITSERTWYAITDRISRGLLALIPIVQPEIIIIGGSMGTVFDRYGQKLNELVDEKLSPNLRRPVIKAAAQPELAVLHGAYIYRQQIINASV